MLSHLKYALPSSQPPTSPFSNLLCVIEHYSPFDKKYLLSDSPKNCLWSTLVRGWWLPVHPAQHLFATALTPLGCLDLFTAAAVSPSKCSHRSQAEGSLWGWLELCRVEDGAGNLCSAPVCVCLCKDDLFWNVELLPPRLGSCSLLSPEATLPHLSPCILQWQDQLQAAHGPSAKC